MELMDWFAKGLSTQNYIEAMQVNKEEMNKIYNLFHYPMTKKQDWQSLRMLA